MNFVVAFKGEAQPLIDFYQLAKVEDTPYPLFRNHQHSLIISGLGRDRAVSATTALHQVTNKANLGWMNLGISGHGSLGFGEAFIAGKITDDSSIESFYPPQIFEHTFAVSCLQTCSRPCSNYQPDLGYDMEAHAFYRTACRFSIRELVQVIKIVSDNPDHDLNQVNPKQVPAMIETRLKEIDDLVNQIDTASLAMQSDAEVSEIIQKIQSVHSFSVTHTHQLHDLLLQAQSLGVNLAEIEEITTKASNARDAMQKATHFLQPKRILG
jgi:adenosylhomocysteine nucleosidase